MKSERRHELQHNDLADWFVDTYERLAPYRNSILGVALLVIVAAIAFSFWRNHTATQAAEGWNTIEIPQALLQSPTLRMDGVYVVPAYVEIVNGASKTYSGTSVGEWSEILAADSFLVFGAAESLGQKEVAAQHLKEALDRYEKTLASATGMARERALFGKARALESAASLDTAIEAYESLNKEFPKGAYKSIVDQRLEALRRPEAAEFYKQLAEYKPKPKPESPKAKLDKIAPLPENPPEEPKAPKTSGSAAPAKTTASKSSAGPVLPEAPKTPVEPPKTEAPKAEPPKTDAPKADVPKSSAAAPAASTASPAKK